MKCPHCQTCFESDDAIYRPREPQRKWRVISFTDTFCPECNGGYRHDLSTKGAVVLIALVLVAIALVEYGGHLYAIPIYLLVWYFFSRHKSVIFKVDKINAQTDDPWVD